MTEVDLAIMENKISQILCEYEDTLRQTIIDLVSDVDKSPIKAVFDATSVLDSSYRSLEKRIYATLPSKFVATAQQEEEGPKSKPEEELKEQPKKTTGIKRPRKPKLETLSEENKKQVAKAKHDYAVNTRLMALGEIKRSMPDILKDVYPYSTVYNRISEPLLKSLEREGIRTPASLANFSFSEVKKLVQKYAPWPVSNSCISAFADIYDITFAPEKETLF